MTTAQCDMKTDYEASCALARGFNGLLTRHHRAPGEVAIIVAALGVLYINASSPKLPLLS